MKHLRYITVQNGELSQRRLYDTLIKMWNDSTQNDTDWQATATHGFVNPRYDEAISYDSRAYTYEGPEVPMGADAWTTNDTVETTWT